MARYWCWYEVLFDKLELNEVILALFGSMLVRYVNHSFQILRLLAETTGSTPTAIGLHVRDNHALSEIDAAWYSTV